MERKLTTIFCTDVVGYSSMMRANEEGTLKTLSECRSIIDPMIERYRGRIFNSAGDSVLAEFASPVNAVRFAIDCQEQLHNRNKKHFREPPMRFRMGINLGDVVVQDTNLMGDVVNLAARIESQADYGGISISDYVYQAIAGKIVDVKFEDRGLQSFKNMPDQVKIWAINIVGAEKNPNVQVVESSDKSVVKFSSKIDDDSTTEEVIKYLGADSTNASISVSAAQKFRTQKDYENLVPNLLARSIRNRDMQSFDELIELSEKKLVPKKYIRQVAAVLQAGNKMILNPRRQCLVGNLFANGYMGDKQRVVSIQIWRNCAAKDLEAQVNLGMALLNLPDATRQEKDEGVEALTNAAKQKNAKAALRLAEYYHSIHDKHLEFEWYWVARYLKEPTAQSGLERLVQTITKAEFSTYKINSEALVEEIEWHSKNNIL